MLAAALVGAAALSMALSPAPAAADQTFCLPGSGAGQCQAAVGVAVDEETGRVYVADSGKDLIQIFDEDGVFEGTIGGRGALVDPQAVAVDNDPTSPTQGQITVIDATSRVLRFDSAGALRLGLGWGVRDGSAEAQTCGTEASPPSVSCLPGLVGKGKCQIFDAVEERSKVAIGRGGKVYVADNAGNPSEGFKNRVEVFDKDGGCAEERVVLEGGDRRLSAIALDSEESIYVGFGAGAGKEIRKLGPGGEAVCTIDPGVLTSALAVDPVTDRLYAGQSEPRARGVGFPPMLTIYEPGCAGEAVGHVRRFGYGSLSGLVRGIGVLPGVLDPSRKGEAALSGNEGLVFQLDEPPPGPILVPGSLIADPVSNTKATLGAEVNPEGKAGQITIEYVEKDVCEADEAGGGGCFDSAHSSGASALAGEGFKLVAAEARFGCPDPLSIVGPGENAYEAGECLAPETAYRFRAAASNPDGAGNSPVDGGEFTTRPWLELGAAWVSSVGTGSARLNAEVNPLGVPVRARFEVVPEAACLADEESAEADPPAHCFDHAQSIPALDFGKGEGFTTSGVSLGELEPGVSYRYRLIASNPLIEDEPVIGETHSFTTFSARGIPPCPENAAFRTGPGALLPDCRGYEMVSPLDKGQGDIAVLLALFTSTPAVLEQSSTSGSRLAYGSVHAFGGAPSAPWTSQYIAERHPRGEAEEGWRTHSINLPIERPIYEDAFSQTSSQLQALSPDLCTAWLRAIAEPPLAPGARAGYPNFYRRTDDLCGGPSLEALTSLEWGNLGKASVPALGLELQGVSEDQETAAFVVPDNLKESGAPNLKGGKLQLYAWRRDAPPAFACVLPGGAPLADSCSAGSGPFGVSASFVGLLTQAQGALSASGERLFWTAGKGEESSEGELYMRERPALGRKPGKECGAGQPCTIAISKPGEKLSETEKSQFRAAAADGSVAIYTTGTDLYEARIGEPTGHPVLSATEKIAGGMIGLLGASQDASHVYFASTEAIPGAGPDGLGEEAKAGERNLYLYDEGSYTFIGALAAKDLEKFSLLQTFPFGNLARVSGEQAAFVSRAPLTGYDNADTASAEPDTEVFLYDAGSDKLICASCNPSGARPAGRENSRTKTTDTDFFAGPEWVAGWFEGHETPLYVSRELSAHGNRLFFNSADALVARDTNGRADVYQWEAPGEGACSTGSPSYSARNGGCVDLISSGLSGRDSTFVDASPSGEDVFFTTLSNLVPADYDLIDVYDARVGGGFPPPPPAPVECEGEACQSPPPAPAPPAPASSGYPASDNVSPPPKGRKCPKGRHRMSRGSKARCAKAEKKRHRKHRRDHGGAGR